MKRVDVDNVSKTFIEMRQNSTLKLDEEAKPNFEDERTLKERLVVQLSKLLQNAQEVLSLVQKELEDGRK